LKSASSRLTGGEDNSCCEEGTFNPRLLTTTQKKRANKQRVAGGLSDRKEKGYCTIKDAKGKTEG